MNEAAPVSVWTRSSSVKRAADFGFVLGVAFNGSEFFAAMSELTLGPVRTQRRFHPASAEFGLVQVLFAEFGFNVQISLGTRIRGRSRRKLLRTRFGW